MTNGKNKATQEPSDDEGSLTHTLSDLHHAVPNPSSRYTAGQITEGTIVLVERDHARAPTARPTACRYCLRSAINRGTCPHGTFSPNAPEDPGLDPPHNPRPDPPHNPRPQASHREPPAARDRHSPASDNSAEYWEAVSPSTTFFVENYSSLGTPSSSSYPHSQTSTLVTPGNSSPYPSSPASPAPRHPCRWGHHHSTQERANRCLARSHASASSSSSSTVTQATVRPLSRDAPSINQSPPRPSAHSGAASTTRADSQTQTPGPAGASQMTTTGYDWFGLRRHANAHVVPAQRTHPAPAQTAHPAPAQTAHPAPAQTARSSSAQTTHPTPAYPPGVPTSSAIAPTGRAYVAHIDEYDPTVSQWYVVTVGTRVGVFSQQFVAIDATYRVSGQHCKQYSSYEDAVRAFRAAEAAGVVIQRHQKS